MGSRYVIVPQQQCQRVAVEAALPAGMLAQGAQFRREHQGAALLAEMQRLLTEAVACQIERALTPVPQGEGEHAACASQRGINAPELAALEQYLGIAAAAKLTACPLELRAQAGVVIDLAVEAQNHAAAGGVHGLRSAWRQIDDGQTPVGQADASLGIAPDALAVRSAMLERMRHGAQLAVCLVATR